MKQFLLKSILLVSFSIAAANIFAQSGTGWDWASTSGKATPSTGRQIRDIVTDASGNVYAVGDFEGSMTLGATTLTTTGDGSVNFNYDADAFVVKYDASGNVQWAKQFGRAGAGNNDRGEVINIDAGGNVYIGGNAGVPFLIKYDNNGNLQWNKSFTLYDLGGINISPDGNLIIMESDAGNKKIYKIDKSTGNILWSVLNTGVGSNSTSTYQDFVDQAGNVYYTAFRLNGGAVNVAGNNFNPTTASTYIASVDNNGVTRWVDELSNVQVQLSYTIDKNGKSYVVIGGGFGSTFQGIAISANPTLGNSYLELNSSGVVVYSRASSPYKALMRVTDNAIYSYGINASTPAGRYTEVYGDNIIKSRSTTLGNDIGVVVKYDLNTRQSLWAETYEVDGSNSLNTIEIESNGKCLVGGSYQTSIKFGSNLFTPASAGQAAYTPLDFFIAQFNPANLLPSPTTTWTGAANNGNWNDAANWNNGAPNGNEKSIIPNGVGNYPTNITTANSTGKLTVGSNVSIALPVAFDVPLGIINDGTIEVKGTGTFQGFNTSGNANLLSGSGRLLFTANSPSTILYDINNSLEINKPAGTIQWNGGYVSGSLFLTAGILNAANPLVLTNPNASLTYSSTARMSGTLKRAINASGTYVFPIGNSSVYAPVTLVLNNITGTQNISVQFPESFAQTTGTTPNINLGAGRTITTKLNNNQWIVTPDVALTGGTYSITLQGGGYTNGVTDATRYVAMKRKDDASPWGFDGTNGTSTQTGGTVNGSVVSNGVVTATLSGLSSFSTFAIGVASSSLAAGTTVSVSNWTGNANNTTWNDAGNWDNGIPNGLINAKISAGRASYPSVYTASDNARSLQNDANSSIKLPYNFLTNGDIINNGTIEVTGANSATFNGFGTSTNGYAPVSGTGKILFTNNSPGIFSGTFNNSIEVNRTTNALYAQNVYVGNNFNIISGNVYTSYSGNETFITLLNPAATVSATPTYPVQGTLTRTVNATGTYNYPIGEGPSRYAPVSITTNNVAGTTTISAQYYSTIYGFRKFTPADNQPTYALNAGQFTMTPGSAATGGTINITLEARGYTNGVADASRYVLLQGSGTNDWQKVNNAVITESGGVITATVSNMPALTVQTVFIIGIKGLTTQWTGAGNNQSWTTASNWTNGVPDNTYKAVFISGSPNYPVSVTTANNAAILDVAAGVNLKLPQGFDAAQGIINNGTIEVTGTTAFNGFANGNTPLSGSGKLLFTSASPASFSSGFTALNQSFELNRAGNFTANTITIAGNLTLTTGTITGNITLSNANAAITYTPSSYIIGTLNRAVNTSGAYTFPIGAADRFVPVTLNLNNMVGMQNITASFSSTINGNAPNTTASGVPVTQLLNAGIWAITPNAQPTSGSYSITLEARGYTNSVADPARYVVLRRDASNYDWGFYGTNGIATQANNVVTAQGTMTGFLREYAIGIANSAVAGTALPVTLSKFEVMKNGANVDVTWQTSSEQNSSKFIVERSADGYNFISIGEVKAQGNSSQLHSYLLKDNSPLQGINHYRLKQVDIDGRSIISEIRTTKFDDSNLQVSVYPNPASDVIRLKGITGNSQVQLINTAGQVVLKQKLSGNEVAIPAAIQNGLYSLRLVSPNGNVIIKSVFIHK